MIDKINDYIIQSILGKGGMATVYLAENPKFGVHVAVKVCGHPLGKEKSR